ncbi:MAG TPA: hypothetical protein VGY54_15990 [Polyangiaceae bacterium]|jgi:hypothetical protein|nr:hypothetical protein [Polyangiaceae bacterium]
MHSLRLAAFPLAAALITSVGAADEREEHCRDCHDVYEERFKRQFPNVAAHLREGTGRSRSLETET